MYDKVIGNMVPLDTDILFVDEADIVIGEGDLVQMEAEQEGHKDEEQADSSLLHKSHPNPSKRYSKSARVMKFQKKTGLRFR